MSSHRRYRELLARRVELTPTDERRLREHLQGCPECRATAAAYEHQWQLLRSLPPLQTPPTLRASVLHRIHEAPRPPVPWYRRRINLFAPLLAAAVLALVGVASVAGSRVIGQHGNSDALSSQTSLHTPKPAGGVHATLESPFSSAPQKPGRPRSTKSADTERHVRQVPGAPSRARSPGSLATVRPAPLRIVPSTPSGTGRSVATPVVSAPVNSVAAGVPASPLIPPAHRTTDSGPSVKAQPTRNRAAGATAQPQATAAPTPVPVGLADGPPPSPVPAPKPPAFAPIQGTPVPAATAAAAAPPVIVVTPNPVDTPMPIIPPTPTPTPTPTALP
jgi:hypothetical protein